MDRPRQFTLAFLFQQIFWIAVALALLRFWQPDLHLSFEGFLFRKGLILSLAGIAAGAFVGNFFGRAFGGAVIGGVLAVSSAGALFFVLRNATDSV